jgi:hypothetical protein
MGIRTASSATGQCSHTHHPDGENAWEFTNPPRIRAASRCSTKIRHRLSPLERRRTRTRSIHWSPAPDPRQLQLDCAPGNKALGLPLPRQKFLRQAAPMLQQRDLALENCSSPKAATGTVVRPQHHSANDREFDELYRKHLSNVYQALFCSHTRLAQPIMAGTAEPSFFLNALHSSASAATCPLFRMDGRRPLHRRPPLRPCTRSLPAGVDLRE